MSTLCAQQAPSLDNADGVLRAQEGPEDKARRKSLVIGGQAMEITADAAGQPGELTVSTRELSPNTWAITAKHVAPQPVDRVEFKLNAAIRIHGFTGIQHFSGSIHRDMQYRGSIPYWKYEFVTGPTLGDPFLSYIDAANGNRFAIGVRDIWGKHRFSQTMSDPTRSMLLEVSGPVDEKHSAEVHETVFFVSLARKDTFEVFRDFTRLVGEVETRPALPVPEWAYDPIYCTWSAIRTYVDSPWLHRNIPIARELGFRTLILDDGWFEHDETVAAWDKPARSMVYVGGWKQHPGKFPDLAGDVRRIQEQGVRVLLWNAPFRVGLRSPFWPRFEKAGWHRTLNDLTAASVYIDPRYPDVRSFVAEAMTRMVRDYGVDGYKVDMVDNVGMRMQPHMDKSVDGVKTGPLYADLMSGILAEIRKTHPDFVVEARMGYSNLVARVWANAYRVFDVPYNNELNRAIAGMLRGLYPDRAIYMDPVIWPTDDADENVGRIMIGSIIAVPQISVSMEETTASHRSIIKHWIGFYQQHRATIMHGQFIPRFVGNQLPEARFVSKDAIIIGLYDNHPVELPEENKDIYVLNGSTRNWVAVTAPNRPRKMTIVDVHGREIAVRKLEQTQSRIDVPQGGYLKLAKE